MEQEQIMQIQMMEQESNHLNQQMQMIEQNINEMNELNASLEELKTQEGEMLINIGKKIYLPVEPKSKKLIVEVGKGNLIEKSLDETQKIVEEQIEKLNVGKMQITERLEEIQNEMMKMISEIEKVQEKSGKNLE